MLMIIILLIVLILLANSFNFCLTAQQTENSKKFWFVVLMQHTSKFVFGFRHGISNYPWRTKLVHGC